MVTLSALYRRHELAFRTQYAELKEQARSAGPLLPGTPGTLYERHGTGYGYWYRVYYAMPGRQVEDLVGATGDSTALDAMRTRIEGAQWMARQVADLRKLEFQVADKGVARVLVELHNRDAFAAGLTVVGTLCYMAWLNELGAKAVAMRTQDLDLARRQRLKLAAPLPFLETVQATRLPFVAVPGLPSASPSTSVKLPGPDGLRVDMLAPGRVLGAAVRVPELEWHAQAIPHYDYLLDAPSPAALLAGGHCVPVLLPAPERLVWHKIYAGAARQGEPEKAAKDLVQAATLAAILVEQQDIVLADSFRAAPAALCSAARRRLPALRRLLAAHPQTLEQIEDAFG
ncbi:MAG: GSU2403 family nucleotidyltransferase fold protein [Caldimonas sp.]